MDKGMRGEESTGSGYRRILNVAGTARRPTSGSDRQRQVIMSAVPASDSDHLVSLFQEVVSARADMTVARRAPLGRSRMTDAPRTRLLLALEAYVAELEFRHVPVPYTIRDDLRIQRRILGKVAGAS
jgi:hypothetical protein